MAASEHFLVTGALGCIGAWIVLRLVQEGVPVVAFDADTDVRRLRLLMDDAQLSRVTSSTVISPIWPCLRTRWTSTASQMSFTWPRCCIRDSRATRRLAPASMCWAA